MAKANKTSFKKGQVANPKGRAKGSINESTKRFSKFKSLAIERYQEAFDLLWSNMQNGEGWAYQIYFKDIMPKKVYQPTVVIKQEEGQPRLEALTTAMFGFEELTHSEALEEIKVLKSMELEDKKNEAEDCSYYTDDELRESYAIHERANARKLSQKTPV
jgi:hypothetical protein